MQPIRGRLEPKMCDIDNIRYCCNKLPFKVIKLYEMGRPTESRRQGTGVLLWPAADQGEWIRLTCASSFPAGRRLASSSNFGAGSMPWLSLTAKSRPAMFLVANQLSRPSYVSLQSALAFHGHIPEYVPGGHQHNYWPAGRIAQSVGALHFPSL